MTYKIARFLGSTGMKPEDVAVVIDKKLRGAEAFLIMPGGGVTFEVFMTVEEESNLDELFVEHRDPSTLEFLAIELFKHELKVREELVPVAIKAKTEATEAMMEWLNAVNNSFDPDRTPTGQEVFDFIKSHAHLVQIEKMIAVQGHTQRLNSHFCYDCALRAVRSLQDDLIEMGSLDTSDPKHLFLLNFLAQK